MKKTLTQVMGMLVVVGLMTGCGSSKQASSEQASGFDLSQDITVVSREDGSGTRGAFIELMGVEQKDENGKKSDYTTEEAVISNSTSVVMTTVQSDEAAIGYISLGSLNDTVKAVKIDGVQATAEAIQSGEYKVARPFNIATKGEVSEVAQDFIGFILSKEGQQVVDENGYISLEGEAFTTTAPTGKIVLAGSSSITPVMEKLKEAYLALNKNAEIEIQESDSTTGMNAASEGICDIGMASRELKESEISAGLQPTVIAMDGIAIVVNKNNSVEELSSEAVKNIYTGEVTVWEDVK